MSIKSLYPDIRPSLNLDFANSKALDGRITFSRNSTATYVGTDGLIKTAAANAPRFDHDPVTGESLGLLIEEQRTNRFANSTTYGGSGWTKQSVTNVTTNTTDVVAPDGSFTATKWEPTTLVQYMFASTNGSLGSSTFTMSVWVRTPAGESTNFTMNLYAPTQTPGASFFTATDTWQRFSWTFTAQSQTTAYPVAISQLNKILYIWGPQIEEGSFATSYIPTTGSTVTRSSEFASITGTNFSNIYNASEGTLYLESKGKGAGNTSSNGTLQVDDGSVNNRIVLVNDDESILNAAIGINAVQTNFTASPSFTTGFNKNIIAYKSGDNASCLNGSEIISNTSVTTIPTVNTLRLGSNSVGVSNNTIRRATYYPKRLTNAQLQLLTQ